MDLHLLIQSVLTETPTILNSPRKKAGVIVPFLREQKQWCILFEKRVEDNSVHSGQICLPGGSEEPKDKNLLQTALRETEEEIGIGKERITILGFIEPVFTLGSYFVIYPFVGVIEQPQPLRLNTDEVAYTFTVPFKHILDLHPFKERVYKHKDSTHTTFIIPYKNEIIWGATSRILDALIRKIKSHRG